MIVAEKLFDDLDPKVQEDALREETVVLKSWEYGITSEEDVVHTYSAQDLINSSRKRLCVEVREQRHGLAHKIKDAVYGVDPMMAHAMVPECFYRGGMCPLCNPDGCNHNLVYLTELIGNVPEKFYRDVRNKQAAKDSGILEGGDI